MLLLRGVRACTPAISSMMFSTAEWSSSPRPVAISAVKSSCASAGRRQRHLQAGGRLHDDVQVLVVEAAAETRLEVAADRPAARARP